MKDAFAKINFGKVEFLGPNQPNPEQLALWDQTQDKIEQLKLLIWAEYQGKSVLYDEIVDKYIDSSTFLQRHIKKAIVSMQEEYLVIEHKKTSTRTVDFGDTVKFFKEPHMQPIQTTLF